LSVEPDQSDWQPAQDALLSELITDWDECPHIHRIRFLHACQSSGLDPFLRQIFTARGRDGDWYIQAHLDGLRIAAQRAADRAGEMYEVEEPVWIARDGSRHQGVWTGSSNHPHAALCAVVKIRGAARARLACDAYWDEYCPTQVDPDTGEITEDPFWATHPMMRLGQVVESVGLRKAYPGTLSAIFLPAEATAIARATAAQVAVETLEHVAEQSAAALVTAAQDSIEEPAETPEQAASLRDVVTTLLARAETLGFGDRIRTGMQQVYGSSDPADLTLEQLAHLAEQAQTALDARPSATPTPPADAQPAEPPAESAAPARKRAPVKKTTATRPRKKAPVVPTAPTGEPDAESSDGGPTKPPVAANRQARRTSSRKADAS
jgi:hypothetical protein